ncbi:MAG: hypothetical protein EOS34_19840 [Mesorhizobium sp.]|nr:MAG: hypothetical protein EOS34_19840 [Mesorhizobium sp.]
MEDHAAPLHHSSGSGPFLGGCAGQAQAAKGKIANDIDPQSEKTKEKRKLSDDVDGLVKQFIEAECKGADFAKTGKAEWHSWELVEASLNRYLVPALGSRSIHHVTDTDIANITKKIVAGGHPQAANTAFWYMRAFFNWCRKPPQRLIAVGLENPAPIVKRKW